MKLITPLVEFSCKEVSVKFGALQALDGVTIHFNPSEITSVIGPNGAGKTTLLNVLSGRQRADSGRVLLGCSDISGTHSHQRARLGIGRSFQITKVFGRMTVLENLRLAAQAYVFKIQPMFHAVQNIPILTQSAEAMLERVGLTVHRDQLAETLSHGDQRALELGLTLMTEPRILLLDEPLAGVGEREIESMMELVTVAAAGRTVILIEHNIGVVMRVSSRVVVMHQGKVLANGSPKAISDDPSVREAYLGNDDAFA